MTRKKGGNQMNASKEIQDEMVGVLTAISIVSKRLANRLIELDKEEKSMYSNEKGDANDE